MEHNNNVVCESKEIANVFGETFEHNSSSQNYSQEFRRYKVAKETNRINFTSDNNESYNCNFSMDELKKAINKSNDSAAGPDDMHYQVLKHLPEKTLKILLTLLNNIWTSGHFPEIWREATIIPIPKPNKNPKHPQNYRPISLTSSLCKTLERMIADRLSWYLETQNLFAEIQSGFRKQRSTIDHLVRLESFVREAFVNKEHVVTLFFDLEKAYDTAWKHGVLQDLHEMGLRGRLPIFIKN